MIWRCGRCLAFSHSTPTAMRARWTCWNGRWSATPTIALATALAAWAHGQRVIYHFAATPGPGSRAKRRTGSKGAESRRRRDSACHSRQRPHLAARPRRSGSSDPQGAFDRRRLGVGVEPQRMDRLYTMAMPDRPSNGSRLRSISLPTTASLSIAWSNRLRAF